MSVGKGVAAAVAAGCADAELSAGSELGKQTLT